MAKKSYKLAEAVNVQGSFQGERFDFTFKAGSHVPKSEQEEAALTEAVEAGAATVHESKDK